MKYVIKQQLSTVELILKFSIYQRNQQKILFARAAMGKPKLLIADEPTRGVDIGAKKSIYELIAKLSDVGELCFLFHLK